MRLDSIPKMTYGGGRLLCQPFMTDTSIIMMWQISPLWVLRTIIHRHGLPLRRILLPLTAPFGGNTSTRDIIIARLGETYLAAAEAHMKAGDAGTGLDRLNEVRARAGVPAAEMADFDIEYILDERARELLGEYYRWFDLKRTGTLVERASAHIPDISPGNFDGNGGNLKILRPIPQRAIDLNQNRSFEQNPAYN